MQHVVAIVGLGALSIAWFLVQRWRERDRAQEPSPPVEGCGFCTHRDSCGVAPGAEEECRS